MTLATTPGIVQREFSQVVADHRTQIFRFLLASTRDPDLAENLTQDCLLKAHRNWARFRGESSPMTWLMRIAINVQKDHWRNRRIQFWRTTRTNSVDGDEASEWLPLSGTRRKSTAGAGAGEAGLARGRRLEFAAKTGLPHAPR